MADEKAPLRDSAGNEIGVGDTIIFNDAGPKLTTGMEAEVKRIESPYLVTRDAHGMTRHVLPSDCMKKV